MARNKLFLAVALSALASSVNADATGATDAAMLKQMAILVENARQELEEMRKTLSVTENLKDLQQQAFVKELTETGDTLGGMFTDINAMSREIEEWQDDPYGTNQITNDVNRMEQRYEYAKERDGIAQGQAYASMLRSLKQIQWLGKVQTANEQKLASGTSEKDESELAASAAVSTNRILLEQEQRQLRQDAISTEIFASGLGAVNYGSLKGIAADEDSSK